MFYKKVTSLIQQVFAAAFQQIVIQRHIVWITGNFVCNKYDFIKNTCIFL